MKKIITFPMLLLCAFLISANVLSLEPVTSERLVNADNEMGSWLTHGRTYSEQRYSPLDKINKDTVGELGLAWSFEFPDNRALEATPIVVDGVMYTSGAWSRVFAHEAVTGKLLWSFDPQVDKSHLVRACCGPVNRGVAVWQDKVFVGTLDGYLVAIDRASGQEVWRTLTIDPDMDYTITGAPRVFKGKVFIGNGGAEFGVRGYVSAYDANTGEMAWRFYTVPGNPANGFESPAMEAAAETWTGEWWNLGGGGTVWDSMAYDPELDLVYIGVGNGSPWNQQIRSSEGGDNLYLSSMVALKPDTGEYVWHYQTTPAETWDFTATQQMILAEIEWKGELRKVIMQAPKNGFFFIIDRETGEYLSAEAITRVLWAKGYDENGRPIENEGMRYIDKPSLMSPGAIGAHNWHSMSYHQQTGYVYIPVIKSLMKYADPEEFKPAKRHNNIGVVFPPEEIISHQFMQVMKEEATRGELLAWDPEKQKAVWRYKHATGWNGGTLSTAGGLVFQGTADHKFMAFDAKMGDVLWEYNTKLAIVAAPVSFMVDGEQYVAVVAKWGGGYPLAVGIQPERGLDKGRLLVFKLGGSATLPEVDMPVLKMAKAPLPMTVTDAEKLKQARSDYVIFCSVCHGMDAVAGGNVPDLRYRVSQYPFETFKVFVLDGVLAQRGMVSFSDVLSEERAEGVYNYILQEANYAWQLDQNPLPGWKLGLYQNLARMFVAAAEGSPRFYSGVALFWILFIGLVVLLIRRKKAKS